jgi:hypothetical protein
MGRSARYCTRTTRLVLESADILCWSARTSICVHRLYYGSTFSVVRLVLHWHAILYDRDQSIPVPSAHEFHIHGNGRKNHPSQCVRITGVDVSYLYYTANSLALIGY